jgi:uncharacterized membrane protein YraQ (UPF0718 family)
MLEHGELLRDRRVLLTLALMATLVALFWAGTRYPQLSEKAAMGGDLAMEDPMAFEAVLPVDSDDPFLQRVLFSTANWAYTNQKGMAFGLLLGAGLMTLLPLLRAVAFHGVLPNTLLGIVIGAPLGVCVNCAAPIARGLHASGARIETSLATMVSSPTLNVVVLAMLFSLFPVYMAAMKLGLTFAFLLLAIPLLTRTVFRQERVEAAAAQRVAEAPSHTSLAPATGASLRAGDSASSGWGPALRWVALSYSGSLWFIVKRTVPLMVLAGLLGALLVTAIPLERVADLFPRDGFLPVAGAMGLVSLVGLLLPVPIAFDVVVVAALSAAGMPAPYAMALLFTLGIFSIYSFSVVWESISLRVATTISVALLLFGFMAAGGVDLYQRWDEPRQRRILFASLAQFQAPLPLEGRLPKAGDDRVLLAQLRDDTLDWVAVAADFPDGIAVDSMAFRPDGGAGASPRFIRHYGETLGLERGDGMPILYRLSGPFYRNWPVAAGDVHGDGWPDILLGSAHGPLLFANRGGVRFVRQRIDVPDVESSYAANVALVDLDGDGWLDIFFSAYRGGNHVIYSDRGRFHAGRHQRLPETGANLANAVGFGDLDRDGDLDIVLGNWSAGSWTVIPPENSRNALLWNREGSWELEPLPGYPGETLAALVSDVNHDGRLDVLLGNDFRVPDMIYLQGGDGLGEPLPRDNDVVHRTTRHTMSIDSADLNNDLAFDLYFGNITGRVPSQEGRLGKLDNDELCDREYPDHAGWRKRCYERMERLSEIRRGVETRDVNSCTEVANPEGRGGCLAWLLLRRATGATRDPALCDLFPSRWERLAYICRYAFHTQPEPYPPKALRLRQDKSSNVLLVASADGRFESRAAEMGVDVAGWTWNAKFADFDNDEWQDLYAVNGFFNSTWRESNVFFQNVEGRKFVDRTEEVGLTSHLVTGAYSAVDLDSDGDLDLVAQATDGPVWVHRNEGPNGHGIVFELRDGRGNPFGIGAKVVVHYGDAGSRHQLREIKASGGFSSFEPPRAHFGLGEHSHVDRVEIEWSTGERTALQAKFPAGRRYRISRQPR